MVALVLGELLHLRRNKRIALLLLGCGWIFVCNIIRAAALVFVAANSGLEALARWHDWIGTAALFGGLGGMLSLAWIWKGQSANLSRYDQTSPAPRSFAPPWMALAWLALIFAGTEIWYRLHERQLMERPSWQVTWPSRNDTVAAQPIPETTRVILRYDDAKTASWEQPRGVRWWSFFAHWKPQRAALQLVRSHSPEICLPAIGRNFRMARPDVKVSTSPVTLDFRSYEFEQNGHPLFVFVCIQEDKRVASGPADTGEWNLRGRLRAAFDGKRNLGQRLLEVAILGLDDYSQASEAFSKTAAEILRAEKPTG
jgi:exosortase/archaeosortase family protein